jgi:APA family basic amino acid/polyamine antiporter
MEKKGLFLRDATGLVRTIGTMDAFLINIAILSPGLGFIYQMWALSFGKNADLTISFIIAGITAIFLALAYSQLVASMPRTGGDYVFTSRLLHPVVGAAIGGAAILNFMLVVGTNSAIFGQGFMPSLFNELGGVFNSQGLVDFGASLSQPWPTFIIGTILIILMGVVTAMGTRSVSQVMWVLFIIGMLGFFSVMGIYLTHTQNEFMTAFNSASGGDAYQSILDAARNQGFQPGVTFVSSLLAVPLCALLYWGFTSANYPAGELKSAAQTLKRSVLIALGSGFVLYVGIWLSVKRLVGLDFLQSVSYLSTYHGDIYSSITSAPALLSYYATILSPNAVISILIPLSFLCWVGVFVLAYYIVISRVTFAMSFDRLLPEWLSQTGANNVPVNSIVASAIGMIIMLALQVFYSGILAGIFNATLIAAILYTLVSLSVVILPFAKPDLFESSPKIARWKVGNVPGVSIIGGISGLFTLFIIYLGMARPEFIGPASIQALIFTVVVFGWGVVAYFIEKSRFKKATGLDLSMAIHEIPPE